jgi:trk system potassium uptake protein TrkH
MSLGAKLRPLLQPARPAVVCRHLGQIALVLAILSSVPTLFAYGTGDWTLAHRLLLGALLPSLALGACALIPAPGRPVQANEALVVSALAFILAAALMTWPLAAAHMPLLDAWFEAMSGVTTTGLSMVPDPQSRSDAFLFTRAWMQWYGGLGMVVLSLSLALASGRPADMRRLSDAASDEDNLDQGVRRHARRLLAVYGLITLAGLALVMAAGVPGFQALIHTLAAISTGGFSGYADSLARLDQGGQMTLGAVALAGALPLHLLYRTHARGLGQLWREPELHALGTAVLLATLLLWWLGRLTPTDALAQAVFAQTTTGYSTLDLAGVDPTAKLVMILSMVTGGGVGSTAGGMKLLRVLILIRVLQLTILRVQIPRHGVIHPEVGGRALEPAQIEHALLLVLLYPLVVVASWLPFLAAGYAPLDALFEVVSAVGTVGLSVGIAGPGLETGLKLLLSIDMLLGRVEVLALLVLLYPLTWYKRP